MATIVGGVLTSHVPAIGGAIHKGLQAEPYWAPFFAGYPPVQRWLASARPDVLVIFYNDHGLNFFLDKMPTFAIGAAAEYRNADEGWGIPTLPAFTGDQDLSWHLIQQLTDAEFDLTTCQEMLVDHAFTLPMALPGVLAGAILAFAKSLGEFGATITFVSNVPGETRTLPNAIYTFTQVPGGDAAALRLCAIAVILSLIALIASEILSRAVRRRLFTDVA